MPELRVEGLEKQFGNFGALCGVDFTVGDGEFFTLLGPSGCGKSTTLNCIAGLEFPTAGSIYLDKRAFVAPDEGIFLPPEERGVGMVFQSYALWPHMTVTENLSLALKVRGVPKRERESRCLSALERLKVGGLGRRFPHELSGGQQQRVALARAIVYSPPLLLLDEPLSNLDAQLRNEARDWIKSIQYDLGITTIYVTHDQEEALAMSDRIAVMRNGVMEQVDTPQEIYEHPATEDVAAFIGTCNFFDATIERIDNGRALFVLDKVGAQFYMKLEGSCGVGDKVRIALRPEYFGFREGDDSSGATVRIEGAVKTRSYLGDSWTYEIDVHGWPVKVASKRARDQSRETLMLDLRGVLVYGQDGRLLEARTAVGE